MGLLADKTGNAITSDTLNLTRVSGVGVALVALGVAVEPFVNRILGENASPTHKTALIIAVVAAWALIAVADMISRSYADAHRRRPVATLTTGKDDPGYAVLAVRLDAAHADTPLFLVLKQGAQPKWVKASELTIDPDGVGATPSSG